VLYPIVVGFTQEVMGNDIIIIALMRLFST
jgi:hypothetical protein